MNNVLKVGDVYRITDTNVSTGINNNNITEYSPEYVLSMNSFQKAQINPQKQDIY